MKREKYEWSKIARTDLNDPDNSDSDIEYNYMESSASSNVVRENNLSFYKL